MVLRPVDLRPVDLRAPVDLLAVDFLRPPVDFRAVDFFRPPVVFLRPPVLFRAVDLRPVVLRPVLLRAAVLRPVERDVDFLAEVLRAPPVRFRPVVFFAANCSTSSSRLEVTSCHLSPLEATLHNAS